MTTYIFGHKNPDTDSVCSSIALSYLKNALGEKTVPKVLGAINNETKFVLDYFKVDTPSYLNDVKVRIKNIKYDKKEFFIHDQESLDNALKKTDIKNGILKVIPSSLTYISRLNNEEDGGLELNDSFNVNELQ